MRPQSPNYTVDPPHRADRASSAGTTVRAALLRGQFQDALLDGHIELFFHPFVSLHDGTVRGVEALMRWQNPERGTIAAEVFLPDLAHSPVMAQATRFVLDEACRALITWPTWSIAVNISPYDLSRPGLVDDVRDALAVHGIDPARLTLETTQADVMAHWPEAIKSLSALRSHGVGLSLDNFGTSSSSLTYLRDFPFTEIKIDRALVAGMHVARGEPIVASVIALAARLGLGVVAEGVETHKQAASLRSLGCPQAQGYLWGEPTPANELHHLHLAQQACELDPETANAPPAGALIRQPAAAGIHAPHMTAPAP